MTDGPQQFCIALVVEDDREQLNLIIALLEETELRVIGMDTAEEALTYLRQDAHQVAFVFTDIGLPFVMDGIDLAWAVNQEWPWISILVTSGYARTRISDLPTTATFMAKPWRALEVLMQAERASKRWQARECHINRKDALPDQALLPSNLMPFGP
jgi:DNA-binding NtrC family response regulator